jgi:hypothetical protein
VVGCWQERATTDDGGHRWHRDDDRLAISTGTVRGGGQPWGGESTWSRAVVAAVAAYGPADAADHLRGLFTAVVVGADGSGAAIADALGFAFLFHATTEDLVVVSSEPGLAARAIARPGAPPILDALGVAGMAHTHDRIGQVTGFAGVSGLPPGAWVELRAGHSPRVHQRPHPWLPTDAMLGASHHDLVEQAALDIEDEILAARTYPAERHLADLTGGKDSRLVLAAVVSAGAVHDFEFWTDGPPELPDVQIARELAEELSLPFDSGFHRGRYAGGYLDQVVAFVEHTAGMHSLWTLKSPPVDHEPWVRLNGLFGEAIRSKVHRPLASVDEAIRFRQRRFGRLGLLRPDARAWWRKQVRRRLVDDAPAGATPADLVDTFQWKERSRNSFGLRETIGGIPRLFPLYSLPLIRAAYAMGDASRRSATLHREIMARADPALVTHRLSGAGFEPTPPAARAGVPASTTTPPAPGAAAATTGPVTASTARNLAVVMRASEQGEQTAALAEILADSTNPAWEHIDRDRALDALGRYDTLRNPERRELAGAATAAVWLRRR